jgi:excisionase family DNA binding protein
MSEESNGSPFDVGEPFLTVPEVAARLDVTAQTIRNWIERGTLPAYRVGRAFRVRREDVDELLARAHATVGVRTTRRGVWDPSPTRVYRDPDAVSSQAARVAQMTRRPTDPRP